MVEVLVKWEIYKISISEKECFVRKLILFIEKNKENSFFMNVIG